MLTKFITTKVAALCGAALISIAIAAPASAVVIFSDNFNRANNINSGWTETEEDSPDVGVYGNRLRLRDGGPPQGAAEQLGLSTAGYENITLSFTWEGINTENFENFLMIEFDTGSGYQALNGFFLGGVPILNGFDQTATAIDLDLAADNPGTFALRFLLDANNNNQVRIDNVVLEGDLIPVPEPGSLALFGLGLAGLGFARRRKVA